MKSSNTEQAIWIGLGSISAFLLTIVSSVVLTNYFAKADYGTYKQVIYVYQTLLIVFTLGIPKAYSYFLPRIPLQEAKSLIRKIRNIFYVLGAMFSMLLFLTSSFIASFLQNPELSFALKVFSPVPFLMLPTMGLENILATYKKTKSVAIYGVVTRLIMLICILVPVVFLNSGYIYAIIGFVIASVFSFILATYFIFLPLRNEEELPTKINYREIITYCYPIFTATIWGMIISSSDQFFISRFFGTEMFAIFSNGSIELPFVGMIVGATSTVLSPYYSKLVHANDSNLNQKLLSTWISVFEKTVKVSYPILLFFMFFSDYFILIFFGSGYIESSTFFMIKLIGNFFTVISFIGIIMAINGNKFYAKIHFYHVLLLVFLQYISIKYFHNPVLILTISVLMRILNTLFMVNYISKYFGYRFIEMFPLALIIKIIIPSVASLCIIRFSVLNKLDMSIIIKVSLGAVLYSILYFLSCFFLKIEYFSLIEPLMKKLNLKEK